MNDYIPTEEEFEIILAALDCYGSTKVREDIANEETLKAVQRLSNRANKAVTDNAQAFEEAFGTQDKDPFNGISRFIADVGKEIDTKALQARLGKAKEDMTLLSAKVIRLRDQYRLATTSKAISNLLNP